MDFRLSLPFLASITSKLNFLSLMKQIYLLKRQLALPFESFVKIHKEIECNIFFESVRRKFLLSKTLCRLFVDTAFLLSVMICLGIAHYFSRRASGRWIEMPHRVNMFFISFSRHSRNSHIVEVHVDCSFTKNTDEM